MKCSRVNVTKDVLEQNTYNDKALQTDIKSLKVRKQSSKWRIHHFGN
jgi:hypothetical protein